MVEIKDITFAYSHNSRNILEKVGFDIEKNQCIAILGNNGAGKSTLLKCVDKICPAQDGIVLVDSKNVYDMHRNEMAQNIAYVQQNSTSGNMTVFDSVLLGRKPYIKWDATSEDRKIVCDIIEQMHLEDFALRTVSELSGGEAQKVMLARALAQEPKVLLLDEPTSNLDPRNQHEVLRIVKKIAQEHNICVAIIIHDLNLAIRYCDRFVFLKDSHVFSYGGLETMTPENIEEVYRIHVHIIKYMGIPVIVPFPDEIVTVNTMSKDCEENTKMICFSCRAKLREKEFFRQYITILYKKHGIEYLRTLQDIALACSDTTRKKGANDRKMSKVLMMLFRIEENADKQEINEKSYKRQMIKKVYDK
ncbi:ABC transporter ATP-binding protein [bacterium]|nr:ABC transporter ATP-binding protein [bacterium]